MSGVLVLLKGSETDVNKLQKSFTNLRNEALRLGETTQFTATQAAEAITFLQRAGFNANQILQSLEGTLNLAAVEGISLK